MLFRKPHFIFLSNTIQTKSAFLDISLFQFLNNKPIQEKVLNNFKPKSCLYIQLSPELCHTYPIKIAGITFKKYTLDPAILGRFIHIAHEHTLFLKLFVKSHRLYPPPGLSFKKKLLVTLCLALFSLNAWLDYHIAVAPPTLSPPKDPTAPPPTSPFFRVLEAILALPIEIEFIKLAASSYQVSGYLNSASQKEFQATISALSQLSAQSPDCKTSAATSPFIHIFIQGAL